MKVVSLWSGGKDSCLACYKARALGYEVAALFNFTEAKGKKSLSHNLPAQLVAEQAALTGLPIFQKATSRENYERGFKAMVSEWQKKEKVEGIVFGDIYLREHKDWIERVCRELKINPIMPLWGIDTLKLIMEFIREGFEAIVVAAKVDLLGREVLGNKIDYEFIKRLDKRIDPCGEKGEFHSLVTKGPMFNGRIEILKSKRLLKGESRYLDIIEWKIYEKS